MLALSSSLVRWLRPSSVPEKEIVVDENVAVIREFVSHWNDQKLCEVMAFAEDGKMHFDDSCSCLIGVASSKVLHDHTGCPDLGHYLRMRQGGNDCRLPHVPYISAVESAYSLIGFKFNRSTPGSQGYFASADATRAFYLIHVIKQVLAERESAQAVREVPEHASV